MTNESDFIESLLNSRQRDKAFKKLIDLYQQQLYWHIRKLVITHENADDVLQNTFLRVYKNLSNFKQNSSLKTWMFRIAYNESMRFLEQDKKKSHYSLNDLGSSYMDNLVADEFFEGDEVQLKLHRILSKLPEKQRQVFQMKYYDNLKFREISGILGIKEGTLKTNYYKAVDQIEKKILNVELLTKTKV
ncbi:MAG: RNA polymerase sigma factor [Bacteroidota bacterium]